MQQCVVTSKNSLVPPTTFIAISTINRHVISSKINYYLRVLNECMQDFTSFYDEKKASLFTESNPSQKNKAIINEQKDILKLKEIYLNLKNDYKQAGLNSNKLDDFIVDPILKPFFEENTEKVSKTISSFFQNRYGFTNEELLNCEFKEAIIHNAKFINNNFEKKGILNNKKFNQIMLNYRQERGFKTRQNKEQTEDDGNIFNIRNWRNSLGGSDDLRKNITKHNMGSIFGSDTSERLKNLSQGNKELDDRIKIAFAEGYMQRQLKEDKKAKTPLLLFRYALIIYILYFLLSQLSITTSTGTNGNGKNGNGINLRALTGNVNFEINPEQVSVKFDDVKGLPEAKKELAEIVDFLKEPEKYTKLGARLPKGVLLVGPPGCGKTLLAKSVAGEAGVPFFQASGSDFDEMFVGTGSKRVRQLFSAARAKAPCVIFIDEIDSVGSTRTNSSIHPHANQTINQLLAEMDGFQKNEGVIVLGATNRRETLDPALMRPGRFDVEVRIDKPDFKARVEMLEFYLDKVAKDKKVDVEYLAKQLTGLGGSAIENVVNQAALRAVVTNSTTVKMEHLEWALDRTLMGYGKSRLMDEECNRNTAYHEAGHVLVAYFTKDSNPLHKVTILPRAQSLGHTAFVPENDGYSVTKSQLLARIDVAFGGRIAEELVFGQDKITTGASNDFQSATRLATHMVKSYGMSEKLGPRVLEQNGEETSPSPQTQEIIDQEIKRILQESYDRAKNILKSHSNELKLIAEALLQHETLDVSQIKSLIENHKI